MMLHMLCHMSHTTCLLFRIHASTLFNTSIFHTISLHVSTDQTAIHPCILRDMSMNNCTKGVYTLGNMRSTGKFKHCSEDVRGKLFKVFGPFYIPVLLGVILVEHITAV